jgi:Fic family protein
MDAEGMKSPAEGMGMPQMMRQMMERMTAAVQASAPMAMCRAMMNSAEARQDRAFDATSELRVLFEEWARNVEDEVLSILRARGPLDVADLAATLKISPESARHFLAKLVREGKATLSGTRGAAVS